MMITFYSQADKAAELDRLDALVAQWTAEAAAGKRRAKVIKLAKARRRKVSGWMLTR